MGRGGKSPSPQKVLSHCVDRVTASPRCSPIASFSRIGTKDPPQWFVTTPAPRKMHGPRLLCLLSFVFLLRGAFPEAVSRALSSTGIPEFALLPLVICAVRTPCVWRERPHVWRHFGGRPSRQFEERSMCSFLCEFSAAFGGIRIAVINAHTRSASRDLRITCVCCDFQTRWEAFFRTNRPEKHSTVDPKSSEEAYR